MRTYVFSATMSKELQRNLKRPKTKRHRVTSQEKGRLGALGKCHFLELWGRILIVFSNTRRAFTTAWLQRHWPGSHWPYTGRWYCAIRPRGFYRLHAYWQGLQLPLMYQPLVWLYVGFTSLSLSASLSRKNTCFSQQHRRYSTPSSSL